MCYDSVVCQVPAISFQHQILNGKNTQKNPVTSTKVLQTVLKWGHLHADNCQWSCKWKKLHIHYSDVMMGAMASQIVSRTIVYSNVYSGADQRRHQNSASLAFVRGIHQWRVNVSIWWRYHIRGIGVSFPVYVYGAWDCHVRCCLLTHHNVLDVVIATESVWVKGRYQGTLQTINRYLINENAVNKNQVFSYYETLRYIEIRIYKHNQKQLKR